MVVKQSIIFAVSAVFFKVLIGFFVAHMVHNVPAKGQRKWVKVPRAGAGCI